MKLVDMHCHLDLMTNGRDIAQEAEHRGIGFFCVPVTPTASTCATQLFSACPYVRVGAGLHPWWIADGSCDARDIDALLQLVATAQYVGEVGLDGGKRGAHALDEQATAFNRMAQAMAAHPIPGRVVSIHAIRAASLVLDTLAAHELTESANCIFHWFSGTTEELWRAQRMGCLFSINEHMLATKRGREYARILPESSLLVETDAPPTLNAPYSLDKIERSLNATLDCLAEIRACDRENLAGQIAARSARLLGFTE